MDDQQSIHDPGRAPDRSTSLSLWVKMRLAASRIRSRGWRGVATTVLVDRFPPLTLLLVLLLLLLTLADGILTLLLLDHHFEEANPAMRILLRSGPTSFVMGKYVLTVIGLPILLIFRRRSVFLPCLRVEHVLPALVVGYVFLLLYQIGLLAQA